MKKGLIYRWLFHISIWAIFYYSSVAYFIQWLPSIGLTYPLSSILVYTFLWISLLVILSYLNYFVFIPRYYLKQKYFYYVGALMLSAIIMNVIKIELDSFYLNYSQNWLRSTVHYVSTIQYMLMFLLMTSWLRISDDWQGKNREQTLSKKSQLEAELKWLKAQINPHFLFNTLNNLYSLAYFNSEHTAPTILKLSGIMRYILLQPENALISIEQEVKFIQDYLDLMTLKERWKNKVTFTVKLESEAQEIEPLLFINFIENAFKHANLDVDDGYIHISLNVYTNHLMFSIENTFDVQGNNSPANGVGLENIKKRLQLIYPTEHNLKVSQTSNLYSVHLFIQFA